MTDHVTADGVAVPCSAHLGHCRICDLIDRDGPHYREDYRRMFHPDEFADETVVDIVTEPPLVAVASATQQGAGIALAGDLVEMMTKRIGADRLAKWVATKTGKPCNCPRRKEALNRLDAKLRAWLAR